MYRFSAFDGGVEADGTPKSRLLVIACVSPSVLDVDDSFNTLKYVTPFQVSDPSYGAQKQGS